MPKIIINKKFVIKYFSKENKDLFNNEYNLNDMKLIADKSGVIWEDAIDGFIRDGNGITADIENDKQLESFINYINEICSK